MKLQGTIALALFVVALAPAAVRADEEQDKQACMADAMSICGQFIPDRERVGNCLVANKSRVSAACRAALAHFDPHGKPHAVASRSTSTR